MSLAKCWGFLSYSRKSGSGQPDDENSQNKISAPAVHWKYHKFLDENIRDLPHLPALWNELVMRKDMFKLALPEIKEVGTSPGSVFRFAENMVRMAPLLDYHCI